MIYKIFNFFLILALVITLSWGFFNSYSSHSLDNIVHVVAIGIDKCEDDNYNMKVSFQFINMSGGSQESSSEESSSVVTSINASTLNKAINLMNSYIGRELNFSHCKVIVFSEDFAKDGISTEIYTLINNEELRPSTNIVVSTSDANNYLKNSNPNIEKLVTNYYDTFELTSNFTGYSDDITIGKFYNNSFSSSKSNTAILGRTFKKTSDSETSSQESSPKDSKQDENSSTKGESQSSQENQSSSSSNESGQSSSGNTEQNDSGSASLEISGQRGTQNVGIAVFKENKYIGQLSEIESICHLLITNNVDSFILSIPVEDYPDNLLDLNVSPVRSSSIEVDTSSDIPHIYISVYCEAKILTVDENSNYTDSKVLKELSTHAENFLLQNIEDYLNKTSKELNCDIDNFSQYAITSFFTIPEWNNYNWISKYANANFNVDVNLNVTSSLLFSGKQ